MYICDRARHLICYPYSIEGLHEMAKVFGLKRAWFHKDHYDIPLKRKEEIEAECTIMTPRDIVRLIKSKNDPPA